MLSDVNCTHGLPTLCASPQSCPDQLSTSGTLSIFLPLQASQALIRAARYHLEPDQQIKWMPYESLTDKKRTRHSSISALDEFSDADSDSSLSSTASSVPDGPESRSGPQRGESSDQKTRHCTPQQSQTHRKPLLPFPPNQSPIPMTSFLQNYAHQQAMAQLYPHPLQNIIYPLPPPLLNLLSPVDQRFLHLQTYQTRAR